MKEELLNYLDEKEYYAANKFEDDDKYLETKKEIESKLQRMIDEYLERQ